MTDSANPRKGVFWAASMTVTSLIGVLMVVGSVLPGVAFPGRLFLLLFGSFLLFVVVRWIQLHLRPPALDDAVVAGTLGGEPALVMRMRSDVPVNALVATGLFAVGFWVGGIWLWIDRGGSPVLPFALALLFTWFVPDAARVVRAGGRVVVSPSAVEIRAWDTTSRMAWDDIQSAEVEQNGSRAVLRLTARQGATSWQTSRRRWIKRFDPRPPDHAAEVFLQALAVDRSAFIAVVMLWHRDRSSRADIGTPQSVADLGGASGTSR